LGDAVRLAPLGDAMAKGNEEGAFVVGDGYAVRCGEVEGESPRVQ